MLPIGGQHKPLAGLMQLLVARDYQQVINYAFVDTAWETGLFGNTDRACGCRTRLPSQMSVMRSSLIGGLLANLQHNLNPQARARAPV